MNFRTNISILFLTVCLFLFINGCGEKNNNRNNPAFLEELANREIKKVADADILKAAYSQGSTISENAQKFIFSQLQEQLQNGDIESALKFCNTNAYPFTDAIAAETNSVVKRTSFKTRNKSNSPDSLEAMLLDSYLYNVENNLTLDDNVQKMDEEYLLYTKPILLNNPLCLQCHGEVGKDISLENYEIIKNLYPEDEAIGYKQGDFRGMWSIKLSRKELIKSL